MKDAFNPGNLTGNIDRHDSDRGMDWYHPMSGPSDEPVEEEEKPSYSLGYLQFILIFVISLFSLRLMQLQVVSGQEYRNLSEGNSVRVKVLIADRGLVFDRNNEILVNNDKLSALQIDLNQIPANKKEREALLQKITDIKPIEEEKLNEVRELVGKVGGIYLLATDLTKEEYLLIKELSFSQPSILATEKSIRKYPNLPGFAHLMGYVGQVDKTDIEQGYMSIETIGKTGLESVYENELKGIHGLQHVEVDSSGKIIHQVASNSNRTSQPGYSLKLGLDKNLQQKFGEALQRAIEKREEEFGPSDLGVTAIAMDPRSGLIRAMVSLPDYDNNLFSTGISQEELSNLYNDPKRPLFNRAIAGRYPPGSTIKPLMATGALQYGIVTPTYALDTPTEITVGDYKFPDWKDHGMTDIKTAIAESNNIFFYMIGGGFENIKGLGLKRIQKTLSWYNFEQNTGIDLVGENASFVLSEEWKLENKGEPIYLGDLYHIAIGQGDIEVTPIRLTTSIAAIANGGAVYQPRLVDSLVNSEGEIVKELDPVVASELPVDSYYLQLVREGMRQAVISGSSRPLNSLSVNIAGKTGTAQFGNAGLTHAWFTGFGPYENPEIVITVLIEGGGGSFETAIPIAEELFRAYFNEPKPVPPPEEAIEEVEQGNETE